MLVCGQKDEDVQCILHVCGLCVSIVFMLTTLLIKKLKQKLLILRFQFVPRLVLGGIRELRVNDLGPRPMGPNKHARQIGTQQTSAQNGEH